MIIQLVNIVVGFILAAPMIKKWAPKAAEGVGSAESTLSRFRGPLGIASLILGALALIERLGLVYVASIGSSFPQAFIALAMGLLLVPHLFAKYPAVVSFTKKIEPYAEWIGVAGIVIGLGSLLFGCMAPFCYPFRSF